MKLHCLIAAVLLALCGIWYTPQSDAALIGSRRALLLAGHGGSPAPPRTPCNAGGLDFSVTTGCNMTFYMVGMR